MLDTQQRDGDDDDDQGGAEDFQFRPGRKSLRELL